MGRGEPSFLCCQEGSWVAYHVHVAKGSQTPHIATRGAGLSGLHKLCVCGHRLPVQFGGGGGPRRAIWSLLHAAWESTSHGVYIPLLSGNWTNLLYRKKIRNISGQSMLNKECEL